MHTCLSREYLSQQGTSLSKAYLTHGLQKQEVSRAGHTCLSRTYLSQQGIPNSRQDLHPKPLRFENRKKVTVKWPYGLEP